MAYSPRWILNGLDLTAAPFMVAVDSWEIGDAEAEVTTLPTDGVDGEYERTERVGNREHTLTVLIEGDAAVRAAALAELTKAVTQPVGTMTHDRQDGSPASVFDIFRGTITHANTDPMQANGLESYPLTIPARPWVRAEQPTLITVPSAPVDPAETPTVINDGSSDADWSAVGTPSGVTARVWQGDPWAGFVGLEAKGSSPSLPGTGRLSLAGPFPLDPTAPTIEIKGRVLGRARIAAGGSWTGWSRADLAVTMPFRPGPARFEVLSAATGSDGSFALVIRQLADLDVIEVQATSPTTFASWEILLGVDSVSRQAQTPGYFTGHVQTRTVPILGAARTEVDLLVQGFDGAGTIYEADWTVDEDGWFKGLDGDYSVTQAVIDGVPTLVAGTWDDAGTASSQVLSPLFAVGSGQHTFAIKAEAAGVSQVYAACVIQWFSDIDGSIGSTTLGSDIANPATITGTLTPPVGADDARIEIIVDSDDGPFELRVTCATVEALGTDAVLGGNVLVATAAATDNHPRFLALRAAAELAGTSDATATSGAYNSLSSAVDFTIPANSIAPGTYAVYACMKRSAVGETTFELSAEIETSDGLAASDPATGTRSTGVIAMTTDYDLYPLTYLTLPPASFVDPDAELTVSISRDTGTVSLDDLFIVHTGDSQATLVNAASVSAVSIESATVGAAPRVMIGGATSGAMLNAGTRVQAFDQPVAVPGFLQVSTVTPGSDSSRVTASYFRRYAFNVADLTTAWDEQPEPESEDDW